MELDGVAVVGEEDPNVFSRDGVAIRRRGDGGDGQGIGTISRSDVRSGLLRGEKCGLGERLTVCLGA